MSGRFVSVLDKALLTEERTYTDRLYDAIHYLRHKKENVLVVAREFGVEPRLLGMAYRTGMLHTPQDASDFMHWYDHILPTYNVPFRDYIEWSAKNK